MKDPTIEDEPPKIDKIVLNSSSSLSSPNKQNIETLEIEDLVLYLLAHKWLVYS